MHSPYPLPALMLMIVLAVSGQLECHRHLHPDGGECAAHRLRQLAGFPVRLILAPTLPDCVPNVRLFVRLSSSQRTSQGWRSMVGDWFFQVSVTRCALAVQLAKMTACEPSGAS